MSWEYVDTDSFFHRLHPITKLLYVATIMILFFFSDDVILLTLLLIFVIAMFSVAKIPSHRLVDFYKIVAIPAPLYPVFALIFYKPTAGEPLIGYLVPPYHLVPFTMTGLVFAVDTVVKYLLVLTLFYFLPLIAPATDTVRALVKYKLPPVIGLSFSTAFSYVPVMLNEAKAIMEAQESRGLRFKHRNPIKALRAHIPLILPIAANSMKRSMEIAMAIESRGFGYGFKNRTYLREFRYQKRDYAVIAACLISMVAAGYVRWLGFGQMTSTLALLPLLM